MDCLLSENAGQIDHPPPHQTDHPRKTSETLTKSKIQLVSLNRP